jgi:hypothetical protein
MNEAYLHKCESNESATLSIPAPSTKAWQKEGRSRESDPRDSRAVARNEPKSSADSDGIFFTLLGQVLGRGLTYRDLLYTSCDKKGMERRPSASTRFHELS